MEGTASCALTLKHNPDKKFVVYYIGIDLGTSGVRACAIDDQAQPIAEARTTLDSVASNGSAIEQDPQLWWQGVDTVLKALLQKIDPARVRALSVNGTSGTLLLTDAAGTPLTPALMYNDSRASAEAQRIQQIAPRESAAHGATSGLAKLLYLQARYPQARHALHQADWIAGNLCKRFDFTDANNALKTGYDVIHDAWPEWLNDLGVQRHLLPQVFPPGYCVGQLSAHWAQHFNLPMQTRIIAGTTDSIAAFIATGATQPGDAVTSLGSTLVLKIISDTPIFAPEFGIYSHRLGNHWLAGGASNSGGAVLRQFFSDAQMQQLTPLLKPQQPTGLNYYPLPRPGERFPLNDATLQPRLTPRPNNDAVFFQGLLEAMAAIEQQGYARLQQLGCNPLRQVITAGGGSRNSAWRELRQQQLNVPVSTAAHSEASYGSALLALRGSTNATT